MAISPAAQRMKPLPDHMGPEGGNACNIAGDGMIVHVALHHAVKPSSHDVDTDMHLTSLLHFDGLESGSKTFGNGIAPDSEAFSIAGPTTDVSKTEKIGRFLRSSRKRSASPRCWNLRTKSSV
jgi:hypothetical protein